MPRSELGAAVDLVRKAPKKLVVAGYGYSINGTEDPWFRRSDLTTALMQVPNGRLILPSAGGYSETLTEFENRGMVVTREQPGRSGRPARLAQITNFGEEVVLETVVYNVTKEGLTVPELFIIPKVVDAVLYDSDLKDRVFRSISGASIEE
jgi:hypothetical protein